MPSPAGTAPVTPPGAGTWGDVQGARLQSWTQSRYDARVLTGARSLPDILLRLRLSAFPALRRPLVRELVIVLVMKTVALVAIKVLWF
jgi:hypothetical protein